jgi:amino acid permease
MVGIIRELAGLVFETFGPFAIPVVLFFVGVVFYAAVIALQRLRGDEDYWAPEE